MAIHYSTVTPLILTYTFSNSVCTAILSRDNTFLSEWPRPWDTTAKRLNRNNFTNILTFKNNNSSEESTYWENKPRTMFSMKYCYHVNWYMKQMKEQWLTCVSDGIRWLLDLSVSVWVHFTTDMQQFTASFNHQNLSRLIVDFSMIIGNQTANYLWHFNIYISLLSNVYSWIYERLTATNKALMTVIDCTARVWYSWGVFNITVTVHYCLMFIHAYKCPTANDKAVMSSHSNCIAGVWHSWELFNIIPLTPTVATWVQI